MLVSGFPEKKSFHKIDLKIGDRKGFTRGYTSGASRIASSGNSMFQNRCSHQPRNKDALSFGWREDFQVSFLCGCQKFRWPTFRSAVLAATFRSRLHLSDINFKMRLDFSCFLDLICGA